jgi:hypothetical protein
MGDSYATFGSQELTQLNESVLRIVPEHGGVNGQDLIEGRFEGGQALYGTEPEVNPAVPDCRSIAPRSLAQHPRRVIQPTYIPIERDAADLPYGEAGPKPDLENAVATLDIQERNGPDVSSAVR